MNKLYINCIARQKTNQCGRVVSEYAACGIKKKKEKKEKKKIIQGQMSAHPRLKKHSHRYEDRHQDHRLNPLAPVRLANR